MQIELALQHEQQRGSHMEQQLDAVSEQLLEAKQALLQEQLRADHLAGQRDSLDRTLRQAQEALHEQGTRDPGRPWAADEAREVRPQTDLIPQKPHAAVYSPACWAVGLCPYAVIQSHRLAQLSNQWCRQACY